jgi:hypothetical protein
MTEGVTPFRTVVGALAALAVVGGAGALLWLSAFTAWARPEVAPAPVQSSTPAYPVTVRPGPAVPRVQTGQRTFAGTESAASCSTCHSTRQPEVATVRGGELQAFHQGLQVAHGSVSCLSCHNASNYDTLRKADGTPVAFPQTQQLCAQCHGPQHRDYQHGSHGGMTGFWDLNRGGRERNTCTDCHDPHAPAYPRVLPVFPPQDRGARQQRDRDRQHGDHGHD